VLGGRHSLVSLEGRLTRGHEEHAVEVELHQRLFGGDEMPEVDRIEGATHDAETHAGPHSRICPLPMSRYLVDVSASSPMGPRAWSF